MQLSSCSVVSLLLILCLTVSCEQINIKAETSPLVEGVLRGFNLCGKILFRNGSQQPRKIKLFVASLPRTGTSSLEAALEVLGYNVLQGAEIADHGQAVQDVYSGRKSVDELFEYVEQAGFDVAGMDVMNHYWRWAADKKMKVILTVRDEDAWARSIQTFQPYVDILHQRPFIFFSWCQQIWTILDDVFRVYVAGTADPNRYTDLEVLKAGYRRHVKEVTSTIPPLQLLTFDVKEGWEPLCRFLGKPVPDVPFPHVNDRESFQTALSMVLFITWTWPMLFLGPLALLLWVCSVLVRRIRGLRATQSESASVKPWGSFFGLKTAHKNKEHADLEAPDVSWDGLSEAASSIKQPMLQFTLATYPALRLSSRH